MESRSKGESKIQQMLHEAVKRNDVGQVKFMIKHVPVSNFNHEWSKDGLTPLLRACKLGYVQMARILVENGAIINHTDNIGNTCLHFAAMGGDIEMVQLLLECCAKTFVRNEKGCLPTIDLATDKETFEAISERMMKDGPTEFVASCQRMNATGQMCKRSPLVMNGNKNRRSQSRRVSMPSSMMTEKYCGNRRLPSQIDGLKKRRTSVD